MFVLRSTQNS